MESASSGVEKTTMATRTSDAVWAWRERLQQAEESARAASARARQRLSQSLSLASAMALATSSRHAAPPSSRRGGVQGGDGHAGRGRALVLAAAGDAQALDEPPCGVVGDEVLEPQRPTGDRARGAAAIQPGLVALPVIRDPRRRRQGFLIISSELEHSNCAGTSCPQGVRLTVPAAGHAHVAGAHVRCVHEAAAAVHSPSGCTWRGACRSSSPSPSRSQGSPHGRLQANGSGSTELTCLLTCGPTGIANAGGCDGSEMLDHV
ncbi:hypothetical protein BRADI_2g02916v3 [Brachypodium distachyon]|uniref:Uncharacterized protein n=1 Tax=Brachypodium distachyon TaxID=15368 RepID=A0A2K2D6L5_BRADI|nr:hypothetical protein BRADI_2g02916v3 [Brachypodium distachyon]